MARTEKEVFEELTTLCRSTGYVHAFAALCLRDTVSRYLVELEPEDLVHLSAPETLIRTELNTLYGLMIREPIDFTAPDAGTLGAYISRSDDLLRELHDAINAAGPKILDPDRLGDPDFNPFASAAALREPIFYAAESAYTFQYRDLAPRKFALDRQWLLDNRGLDIDVAREVAKCLMELLAERLGETFHRQEDLPVEEWAALPGFTFTCAEVAGLSGCAVDSVTKIIEAFCVPGPAANDGFTSLEAFNAAYSFPILRKGPDEFVMMQAYGITEALYDTPFYWMGADKKYVATAMDHRGRFAEEFSRERLARVFGDANVYMNVEIIRSKSETLGEIDVLVVFGDRLLVLQAKSKKLSLPARNGNDLVLKGDFKRAVQEAVDQAYDCAGFLGDPAVTLRCRDGVEVKLRCPPKTIFPMAVVTDHYPALAFQARHLLEYKTSDVILAPLVIDVFALDVMTEMLSSPLRFLSYLWLRAKWSDSFMSSHEITLLSFHLQQNLWVDAGVSMVMLHDDISTPLDVAMAVRRGGLPGPDTPDGVLTRFAGTLFGRLVEQIEHEASPAVTALGFALMELGGAAIDQINLYVGQIIRAALVDGKLHDFTLGTDNPVSGITFHVNTGPINEAEARLREHCRLRAYRQRANTWHGVILDLTGSIRLAATWADEWRYDADTTRAAAGLRGALVHGSDASSKVGRNAPCPCGSGRKFKKCCL